MPAATLSPIRDEAIQSRVLQFDFVRTIDGAITGGLDPAAKAGMPCKRTALLKKELQTQAGRALEAKKTANWRSLARSQTPGRKLLAKVNAAGYCMVLNMPEKVG